MAIGTRLSLSLINILKQLWSKISIHRFASDKNRKSKIFNSRYLCLKTEGINAFSFDWSNDANLLVAPKYLIPRAIKHFLKSLKKSKAILICPYWPSVPFWPLLASGHDTYSFPLCQGRIFDWKSSCVYKAGRQQEINFRFTRQRRLFYYNFNDKIKPLKNWISTTCSC